MIGAATRRGRKIARGAVLLLSMLLLLANPVRISAQARQATDSVAPTPASQESAPPDFGPILKPAAKPTPLWIKLTVAGTTLLVALIALLFSLRAWRSWNLFDRQYRFPPVKNVALRLGAPKSGGYMATINFSPGRVRDSTAEDA